MKSLFEPTLFDQSVGEFTKESREYLFDSLSNPINQVRADDSLREPKQHEIDPPHQSVVAMCSNHYKFRQWCENELTLMGITKEDIEEFKGLANAALRCIPTPKLLKEMDMYSINRGEDDAN